MEELKKYGIKIYDQWANLWNRNFELAETILAPGLVLHYAQAGGEIFDNIKTPEQLLSTIELWHNKRNNLIFRPDGEPVVDLFTKQNEIFGLVARPYFVSFIGEDGIRISRSGTDILKLENGKIHEVWSVSSGVQGRTFYPESL